MGLNIKESRVIKNTVTNSLGLLVTVFNQIVLLPVYLKYWSAGLYSDWLVLSAISAFFTASDLGFTTVFTNDFVISHAQQQYKKCSSILTNNYFFLFIILVPITIAIAVFAYFCDIVRIFNLHEVSLNDARLILLLFVIHVFITMIGKVPNAIYRAVGKAHVAFLIDNLTWFAESVIILFCLIFRVPMLVTAFLFIIPRFVTLGFKVLHTKLFFNYKFEVEDINTVVIIKSILPSFSIASFPLSNTVIMQGFSLIINKFFGASELVQFNTTRTLANMIKFCSNIITNSFYPEFSIAYGKKDSGKIHSLNKYCIGTAVIMTIAAALIILPFGDLIFKIWTGNRVQFSFILMTAFLFVIALDNLWNASFSPLISVNKHKQLGFYALLLSIIQVVISLLLAIKTKNVAIVVISLIFMHLPMIFFVRKEVIRFLKSIRNNE